MNMIYRSLKESRILSTLLRHKNLRRYNREISNVNIKKSEKNVYRQTSVNSSALIKVVNYTFTAKEKETYFYFCVMFKTIFTKRTTRVNIERTEKSQFFLQFTCQICRLLLSHTSRPSRKFTALQDIMNDNHNYNEIF